MHSAYIFPCEKRSVRITATGDDVLAERSVTSLDFLLTDSPKCREFLHHDHAVSCDGYDLWVSVESITGLRYHVRAFYPRSSGDKFSDSPPPKVTSLRRQNLQVNHYGKSREERGVGNSHSWVRFH